jgi:hypothetical protein
MVEEMVDVLAVMWVELKVVLLVSLKVDSMAAQWVVWKVDS